ncbi:MAG: porphobilinogen synthase [Planctomycetota bacterium]|nr:MAG: porphobilinogen synthase [Planctomycetota bacterium]
MTRDSRLDLPQRPRRLRRTPLVRDLVAETDLRLRHLVQGHFVLPGADRAEDIATMPGIQRLTVDRLVRRAGEDLARGVRSLMLFGVPEDKDGEASGAVDPDGEVPRAVRALKAEFGDELVVMVDVCLCPYTDHGHCGFVEDGEVVNDPSVARLAEMAEVLAAAGADFVCPSDMMDGRVGAIRAALDRRGFTSTGILAYTAKYASAFYGPFRDAAGSAPGFGDRKSYQMDPRNRREALRELRLDLDEGADLVMVKPALAYLDVIADVAAESDVPVVAYNVSGEYSMVKTAAREGLADERAMTLEVLGAIRRAGADLIITYHAAQAAAEGWLDR